jgi:hypothetical protein
VLLHITGRKTRGRNDDVGGLKGGLKRGTWSVGPGVGPAKAPASIFQKPVSPKPAKAKIPLNECQ